MSEAPGIAARLAEFLALVDWAAAAFVVLIGAAWLHLLRMDRDPATGFRMVQFITNPDGSGNSASLAYVGIFLIGCWLLFYLVIHDREVDLIFGAMMAGFVTGSIWRGATGSKERIASGAKPPEPGAPTP